MGTNQGLYLLHQTSAISTRCDTWQNGAVAVTGHSNGTIALWGLSYPSDIEQEKKMRSETASKVANDTGSAGVDSLPPSGLSTNTECKASLRIDRGRHGSASDDGDMGKTYPSDDMEATTPIIKVVPTCRLYIMKLLLDHRSSVTALTLGPDQRQLLSGDADGNCIRWVDDSISINIM